MKRFFWRVVKSFAYRSGECAYRVFPKKGVLTFYCYMTYILRAVTWRLVCKYYGRTMTEHRGDMPEFVLSQISPDDTVIDVGCAEGNLTRLIAKKAKKVVAVELDKKYLDMIDMKEDALRRVSFINGDIVELQFGEVFDVAVLIHTIEHMANADVVLRKLSSLARMIVVETPDRESDWLTGTLLDLGIEERGDDTHVRLYDAASLKRELELSGWGRITISKGNGAVRAVAHSASLDPKMPATGRMELSKA